MPKVVTAVTSALRRRVVQGSPGSTRPLRLVPVRSRRVADQYHRSDFNHESSTQENDHSIHISGQTENTGNINNMLGGSTGGATVGDFNAGLAPVIQTTISTTINPIYGRSQRRFRARSNIPNYEYDLYEYYDDVEPVRQSRPFRRRSHHRRKHIPTQVLTTTTPSITTPSPISKTELLQDLISQGLLDPQDLLAAGYFNTNQLNHTEGPSKRERRSNELELDADPVEPEILNPDYIGYDDYLSEQRDRFWNDVIPIMVAYELDFNIEITVSNEPIMGIYTPVQTLNVNQLRNPYPIRSKHRRSTDSDPTELGTAPNATSFIEIRNITRKTYEKTSFSNTTYTTHHINYQALCFCLAIIIVALVLYRHRHNATSE